jgi:hypothetical protein
MPLPHPFPPPPPPPALQVWNYVFLDTAYPASCGIPQATLDTLKHVRVQRLATRGGQR